MKSIIYIIGISIFAFSCGAELPFLSSGGSSGDSKEETTETTNETNTNSSTNNSGGSSETSQTETTLTCTEKKDELSTLIKSECTTNSDCEASCKFGSCTFSYNANHSTETLSSIGQKYSSHIDPDGNTCVDNCMALDCITPNNSYAICVSGSCQYSP